MGKKNKKKKQSSIWLSESSREDPGISEFIAFQEEEEDDLQSDFTNVPYHNQSGEASTKGSAEAAETVTAESEDVSIDTPAEVPAEVSIDQPVEAPAEVIAEDAHEDIADTESIGEDGSTAAAEVITDESPSSDSVEGDIKIDEAVSTDGWGESEPPAEVEVSTDALELPVPEADLSPDVPEQPDTTDGGSEDQPSTSVQVPEETATETDILPNEEPVDTTVLEEQTLDAVESLGGHATEDTAAEPAAMTPIEDKLEKTVHFDDTAGASKALGKGKKGKKAAAKAAAAAKKPVNKGFVREPLAPEKVEKAKDKPKSTAKSKKLAKGDKNKSTGNAIIIVPEVPSSPGIFEQESTVPAPTEIEESSAADVHVGEEPVEIANTQPQEDSATTDEVTASLELSPAEGLITEENLRQSKELATPEEEAVHADVTLPSAESQSLQPESVPLTAPVEDPAATEEHVDAVEVTQADETTQSEPYKSSEEPATSEAVTMAEVPSVPASEMESASTEQVILLSVPAEPVNLEEPVADETDVIQKEELVEHILPDKTSASAESACVPEPVTAEEVVVSDGTAPSDTILSSDEALSPQDQELSIESVSSAAVVTAQESTALVVPSLSVSSATDANTPAEQANLSTTAVPDLTVEATGQSLIIADQSDPSIEDSSTALAVPACAELIQTPAILDDKMPDLVSEIILSSDVVAEETSGDMAAEATTTTSATQTEIIAVSDKDSENSKDTDVVEDAETIELSTPSIDITAADNGSIAPAETVEALASAPDPQAAEEPSPEINTTPTIIPAEAIEGDDAASSNAQDLKEAGSIPSIAEPGAMEANFVAHVDSDLGTQRSGDIMDGSSSSSQPPEFKAETVLVEVSNQDALSPDKNVPDSDDTIASTLPNSMEESTAVVATGSSSTAQNVPEDACVIESPILDDGADSKNAQITKQSNNEKDSEHEEADSKPLATTIDIGTNVIEDVLTIDTKEEDAGVAKEPQEGIVIANFVDSTDNETIPAEVNVDTTETRLTANAGEISDTIIIELVETEKPPEDVTTMFDAEMTEAECSAEIEIVKSAEETPGGDLKPAMDTLGDEQDYPCAKEEDVTVDEADVHSKDAQDEAAIPQSTIEKADVSPSIIIDTRSIAAVCDDNLEDSTGDDLGALDGRLGDAIQHEVAKDIPVDAHVQETATDHATITSTGQTDTAMIESGTLETGETAAVESRVDDSIVEHLPLIVPEEERQKTHRRHRRRSEASGESRSSRARSSRADKDQIKHRSAGENPFDAPTLRSGQNHESRRYPRAHTMQSVTEKNQTSARSTLQRSQTESVDKQSRANRERSRVMDEAELKLAHARRRERTARDSTSANTARRRARNESRKAEEEQERADVELTERAREVRRERRKHRPVVSEPAEAVSDSAIVSEDILEIGSLERTERPHRRRVRRESVAHSNSSAKDKDRDLERIHKRLTTKGKEKDETTASKEKVKAKKQDSSKGPVGFLKRIFGG